MKTGKVLRLCLKSILLVLSLKMVLLVQGLREMLRRKRKERKEKKFRKKERKRLEMERTNDGIPGMPDSPDELLEDSSKPSIVSPGSGSTEVTRELAGDLLNLPFQAWSLFNPVVLPLSPHEQELLAGPFSRILEKYGMGKIAKDEIVFGFYLTAFVYGRVKAIKDSKGVRDDSRKAGKGKDNVIENAVTEPI